MEWYKKTQKKSRSKKSKRSHIKYFLTIDFLTETTQKCANFVDVLLVLRFLKLGHLSDLYSTMTILYKSERWANNNNNNNNNNIRLYYLECRACLGPHSCYLFKIRMLRTKKFVRVVNYLEMFLSFVLRHRVGLRIKLVRVIYVCELFILYFYLSLCCSER